MTRRAPQSAATNASATAYINLQTCWFVGAAASATHHASMANSRQKKDSVEWRCMTSARTVMAAADRHSGTTTCVRRSSAPH